MDEQDEADRMVKLSWTDLGTVRKREAKIP